MPRNAAKQGGCQGMHRTWEKTSKKRRFELCFLRFCCLTTSVTYILRLLWSDKYSCSEALEDPCRGGGRDKGDMLMRTRAKRTRTQEPLVAHVLGSSELRRSVVRRKHNTGDGVLQQRGGTGSPA